ncbi:hypothetical protein ACJX0J_033599 [Zea mays]
MQWVDIIFQIGLNDDILEDKNILMLCLRYCNQGIYHGIMLKVLDWIAKTAAVVPEMTSSSSMPNLAVAKDGNTKCALSQPADLWKRKNYTIVTCLVILLCVSDI